MTRKRKSDSAKKARSVKAKGPFLALAVLCENMLQDKDGVNSLIRIIDTFTVQAQTPAGEPIPSAAFSFFPPTIAFQLVIGFKSGQAKGNRTLKLIAKMPSGQVISESATTISLDGEQEPRGSVVRIPMYLGAKEQGVYWIDVLLNDELMTQIPLRVRFEGGVDSGSAVPPSSQTSGRKR